MITASRSEHLFIRAVHGDLADVDFSPAWRTITLYLFLLMYEFSSRYMLEHLLATRFGYTHISYAPDRYTTYFWVCLLTPIAVLPAGTRLNTAAQFVFPVLCALITMTTPLFLIAELRPSAFWPLYTCLFISMLMLAFATRIQFTRLMRPLSVRTYKKLILALVGFFAILLGMGAAQNFRFVGLLDIYDVRNSAEYIDNFTVRIVCMYVFSLGGLLAGLALIRNRYGLFAIAMGGFIFCFAISQLKSAILGPAWLGYIYLSMRFFSKGSTVRFYMTLTAPFFFGMALLLLFPNVQGFDDNWSVFAYFAFISFRFYGTSNEALGLYYEFFRYHPTTSWSHISGVNWFVHYPYYDQLSVVMNDQYGLGNLNAGFLSTDAIAAYGYEMIPLVTVVMALIYVILNTAARGIQRPALAMMMVMPALMFNERPLPTSLLTGAVIFFIFYLAWIPDIWRSSLPIASK